MKRAWIKKYLRYFFLPCYWSVDSNHERFFQGILRLVNARRFFFESMHSVGWSFAGTFSWMISCRCRILLSACYLRIRKNGGLKCQFIIKHYIDICNTNRTKASSVSTHIQWGSESHKMSYRSVTWATLLRVIVTMSHAEAGS